MQLAGNWNVVLASGDPTPCVGTMGLTQAGESLGGNFSCTAPGKPAFQGSISGSLSDASVSLVLTASGFTPALVTATASSTNVMAGTVNGSGWSGDTFNANRF